MTTAKFLEALRAHVAGLEIDGKPIFEATELWDSDDPDKQLDALQKSKRRFALVMHEGAAWDTQQHGRVQTAQKTVTAAINVSNRMWVGDENTAGKRRKAEIGPDVLDVLDALEEKLRGDWVQEVVISLGQQERFRPGKDTGTAEARIIYRLTLSAKWRDRAAVSLTR